MAQINVIKQEIVRLRTSMAVSSLSGNYKNFKQASKEYAKLAVNNYDLAKESCAGVPRVTVSVFLRQV